MGWFWADTTATPSAIPKAPHPFPVPDSASPPPSCPMHKPSVPSKPAEASSSIPPGSCPYTPPDKTTQALSSAKSSTITETPTSSQSSAMSTLQKLNPLNYMPSNLSNAPAENQTHSLPLEREPSTILKGDGTGTWEYPSPQQMYNAMLRKGYTDTDTTAVESMVSVHNFLNEGAWGEILEWERRFGRGLAEGWRACARGEEGSVHSAYEVRPWQEKDIPEPRLARFMGRPGEMTPKASILQALGKVWPLRFGGEPPFDRHDWYVRRCDKEGNCREMRYVIDYYEGPEEASGEPVFFLDVRPAIDTPTQALERAMRWGGDIWWRASGGVVRELKAAEQQKQR